MSQRIDEVIAALTEIIDGCLEENSRLGYFPALYRKVTVRIGEGVESGEFENSEQMSRLDVVFANRYIEAFHQYRQGLPTTRSWQYAFEMAERPEPLLIQHLLLGMNAHINLDLGIAAAELCRGRELHPLKPDFFQVNEILSNLFDQVQDGINRESAAFKWVDRLAGPLDEAIGRFSLKQARRAAWGKAERLHGCRADEAAGLIDTIDREVAAIAQLICSPDGRVPASSRSASEEDGMEPRQIIRLLS